MSPSPAIPHINESKMKLYEMFAQKQMAPPPNLTHPAISSIGNNGTTSTTNSNNLFNFHDSFQSTDLFTTKVEQMLIELDRLLKQSGNLPFSLLPPHHDIILVMRQIPLLINQSAQPTLLRSVVEKVVFQLYQSNTGLSIEVYCRFLQTLLELSPSILKETLSWILYSEDERKYNVWIITSLVRFGLIPLEEYDIQLAKQLNKENPDAQLIEFTTELLQNCLLTMHPITSLEDHVLVINALKRLHTPKAEELIQDLKNRMAEVYKTQDDSFTLRLLLAEWTRVCRHSLTSNALYTQFAERILQTTTCDTERLCFFFRLCTETCIDLYQPSRPQSIDAYTKLVGYMVRIQDNYTSKITMASHVLSVVVLVLAHQHGTLNTQFNQKPFLKLLSSLFIELNQSTSQDKETNCSFITIYSDTLYTLEPRHFSGFAFSWLQLFSHRLYLPLLLSQENQQNGWTICFKLMSAHLSFLKVLLQQRSNKGERLGPSEKAFYQGTLRFLVVMLHDYPEFLCEHYLSFIQLLPSNCIQLRNVILSSFPRDMILPDPFATTLGYMDATTLPPRLFIDEDAYYSLEEDQEDVFQLKDLDAYLTSGQSVVKSVGTGVTSYITTNDTYDSEKIQQLVFYVGTKSKLDTTKSLSENPAIQIYKYLLSHMPSSHERYLLVNSIVDHLRYPNRHTYFFSMALLHLFTAQSELVKELITRVLLERLIVNRPHPWGLLTTFIQLIKEPHFSDLEFIKCSMNHSPDIKRLFENVLKSTRQMS